MSKVSIKIHNEFGVNKLKAEDLSPQETLALFELAKTLVPYGIAEAPDSLYLRPISDDERCQDSQNELTEYLLAEGQSCNNDQEPVDKDENVSVEPTFQQLLAENAPTLPTEDEEDEIDKIVKSMDDKKEDDGSLTRPAYPVTPATTNVGDKLAEAFSSQFGTAALTEDDKLLTPEEQVEILNKDYFTTGVKHKIYGGEIVPFYRVRWSCPKCGDKGNHYAPENVKQVFCYNCNAVLLARPANVKFPNRDEWGNFFVADELNMKFQRA